MSALGVLYNPMLPQGSLLDAIKFSETGHLSDDKAQTAVSRAGAVGPYQFMQKFLPDFGYGMPKNIPLADVQDTAKSRQLADRSGVGKTTLVRELAHHLHSNHQPVGMMMLSRQMSPVLSSTTAQSVVAVVAVETAATAEQAAQAVKDTTPTRATVAGAATNTELTLQQAVHIPTF